MKKQAKYQVFSGQRHDKATVPAKGVLNKIRVQLKQNEKRLQTLKTIISNETQDKSHHPESQRIAGR